MDDVAQMWGENLVLASRVKRLEAEAQNRHALLAQKECELRRLVEELEVIKRCLEAVKEKTKEFRRGCKAARSDLACAIAVVDRARQRARV